MKLLKIKQTWSEFLTRTKWAITAFNAEYSKPSIELGNGIILDLENNRVVVPTNFSLHTKGDLVLSSDQHVIIKSGQNAEERPGYVHSIWFNPIQDINGRPLLDDDINTIKGYKCLHQTLQITKP